MNPIHAKCNSIVFKGVFSLTWEDRLDKQLNAMSKKYGKLLSLGNLHTVHVKTTAPFCL